MMLEGLAREIDSLDPPVDAVVLRELIGLSDRLMARISSLVAEVDGAGLWEEVGATSMTAWLRAEAGQSSTTAGRLVRTAGRLSGLPVTWAAWASSQLTGGQVDAVVSVIPPRLVEAFAASEAGLVPTLVGLSPSQTVAVLKVWVAHADQDGVEPEPERRSLHVSTVGDTAGVIKGTLGHEGAAVTSKALAVAMGPYDPDDPRSRSERMADALVDVCRFFLDNQQGRTTGRNFPHVNILTTAEDLARHRGGTFIEGDTADAATVERYACFAHIHRVITSGKSAILDYGVGTRVIPAPLYNAVVIRDRHCRFPGCDRPASWCEVHHVREWQHGGPTTIGNLVLLCSRHHHLIHDRHLHVTLDPDTAELTVTLPNGTTRTTRPPGTLDFAA